MKPSTSKTYQRISNGYIVGPLLIGTPADRSSYRQQGVKPEGTHIVDALGPIRIADLSTGDIRRWHRMLVAEVGGRTAAMAKTFLRAALALAAEDFSVRPPPMPTKLGRGRPKNRRTILTPAQVGVLLRAAIEDPRHGLYYSWTFLVGTRPSEQLAVCWSDVDLERNVVSIRRMQERTGELYEMTKTAAGTREIPLSPILLEMLVRWRLNCPHHNGEPYRAFPGPRGRPLTYRNFHGRIYRPALLRIGVPYVPPHSARHCFISALQANGVEIGLVAKLAGHANPFITLSHYTHSLRSGDRAILALEASYLKGEGE